MKNNAKPSGVIQINPITGTLIRPNLLLKDRVGNTIGKINYENLEMSFVGKGIDEFSINVHKSDNNKDCVINGKTRNFWNQIQDLAIIDWKGYGLFEIDVTVDDEDETIKSIVAQSLEVELGQRPIREMHINDEEAVTYAKRLVDYDDQENFIPTILYDEDDEDHSVLCRVLKEKTPQWTVGHVDTYFKIGNKVYRADSLQRTFTISNTTSYDFFDGELSKEVCCIFTYDTYNRKVNCYNLEECVFDKVSYEVLDGAYKDETTGLLYDADGKILDQSKYAYCNGIGRSTNIFISKNRVANSFSTETDKDSLKNCFYVCGGDDDMTLFFPSVNANGSNYIMNFDQFQTDMMPDELVQKLTGYSEMLQKDSEDFYRDGGVYIPDDSCYYDEESGVCKRRVTSKVDRVLPTAIYENGKVYVLNTYAYYDKTKNKAYDGDGNLLSDYIYREPGLYTDFSHAQDRLMYLTHEKMPFVSIDQSNTAQKEFNKIQSYFNKNKVMTQTGYTSDSFANVTRNVEAMIGVVCDSRYDFDIVNRDGYEQSCVNGKWTGYITLKRTIDETDYIEPTKLIVTIEKVSGDDGDIAFAKQKLDIAISKMEIAELDLPEYGDKDTDKKLNALFSQYNSTSLKEFITCFESCLVTLDDLYSKLDKTKVAISNSFSQIKQLYSHRKEICQAHLDSINLKITDLEEHINYLNDDINEFIENHDMKNYFGNEELWLQFQSYIREDEYTNSNYIAEGLSDSEILYRAKELKEVAESELKEASKLKHTISASLNNIFTLKELESIKDKFSLFNYIYCRTDDKVFKLRLLEIKFSEDNPEQLDVTFSDKVSLVNQKLKDVEDILNTSSSIATSYSSTTRQANQGANAMSTFESMKEDGLNSAEYIIRNSNAEVIQDDHGTLYRQMGDVGEYSEDQLRITPAGIYLTSNAWDTTGMAIGTIIIDGKAYYGVIADRIIGDLIAGENLIISDKDGSVKIDGSGVHLKGGNIDWETPIEQSNVNGLESDIETIKQDAIDNLALVANTTKNYDVSSIPSGSYLVYGYGAPKSDVEYEHYDYYLNQANGDLYKYINKVTYWDWQRVTTLPTVQSSLNTAVGTYLGLPNATTLVGGNYVISPFIGAGYFYAVGDNYSVEINPKVTEMTDGTIPEIFSIKKKIDGSLKQVIGFNGNGDAEFLGKITATSGYIGDSSNGWTIGDSSIYNKCDSVTSTTAGTYIGVDGIRNYNSTTSSTTITNGELTTNSGKIGSLNINEHGLENDGIKIEHDGNDTVFEIYNGFGDIVLSLINSEGIQHSYRAFQLGNLDEVYITSYIISLVGHDGIWIDAEDIYLNGTVHQSSSNSTSSDRTVKKEISLINISDSANFIYSLKPSEFKYNDGTSDRFHHGFIAQEVKESMGDEDWGVYVDSNPDEEGNKALRYEELIADVVGTIQYQKQQLD